MHENDANYAEPDVNQLIDCYMAEIRPFYEATQLREFNTLLNHFGNYKKFLKNKVKSRKPMPPILEASNRSRILQFDSMNPEMRIKFYAAHLAACCVLFKDQAYVNNALSSGDIYNAFQRYIMSLEQSDSNNIKTLMSRINALDSVRIIHILRILGLVQRPSSSMYQLGLGAASGIKDMHYIHALPNISNSHLPDKIRFDYTYQQAADVMLFDYDSRFKSTYEQYASNPDISVTGYIGKTIDILSDIEWGTLRKRNMITVLRAEPAMIPDINEFLRHLHPAITSQCDFIFSIGSGDDERTFQQRIDLTTGLFDTFSKAGLEPVLIKLHDDGTLIEQAGSLRFGSPIASSYEIIYCSLEPAKLQEALG